ncbi:MAG: hypothetical protein M1819_003774 [Sarea resinae]|nr:MAG: hypothetical protein M1819_003774 [Sarea resinae]
MSSKSSKDMATLSQTLQTTQALLTQFLTLLKPNTSNLPPANRTTDNPPDALAVLHTSATLLKAQTTKLALLLTTPPFTPTALTTVVRAIANTCLPAMMTAVELCRPEVYTETMRKEVQARVRRALVELQRLVEEVGVVAGRVEAEEEAGTAATEKEKGEKKEGKENGNASLTSSASKKKPAPPPSSSSGRTTLASTGVLWEACDALLLLHTEGLAGLVARKAEEYCGLLNDAIEELKEWSLETSFEEGEGESDNDEEDSDDEDDEFDFFGSPNKLPKADPKLRAQLNSTLRILKLISLLYRTGIKRRFKFLPAIPPSTPPTTSSSPSPSSTPPSHASASALLVAQRIDSLMPLIALTTTDTDDLASAFYELDAEEAVHLVDACTDHAKQVAGALRSEWVYDAVTDEEQNTKTPKPDQKPRSQSQSQSRRQSPAPRPREDDFSAWIARWEDLLAIELAKFREL